VTIDNTTAQGDETGPDNIPPGTDWWDVETTALEIKSRGPPLDVWDPLLPHDTGCKCGARLALLEIPLMVDPRQRLKFGLQAITATRRATRNQ